MTLRPVAVRRGVSNPGPRDNSNAESMRLLSNPPLPVLRLIDQVVHELLLVTPPGQGHQLKLRDTRCPSGALTANWYWAMRFEVPDSVDSRVRAAMFDHIDRLLAASWDGSLCFSAINRFSFDGRMVRLIVQTGIWKPAGLGACAHDPHDLYAAQPAAPLCRRCGEGVVHYKYRGSDPNHSDNRALRQAMVDGLPLTYFRRSGEGRVRNALSLLVGGRARRPPRVRGRRRSGPTVRGPLCLARTPTTVRRTPNPGHPSRH